MDLTYEIEPTDPDLNQPINLNQAMNMSNQMTLVNSVYLNANRNISMEHVPNPINNLEPILETGEEVFGDIQEPGPASRKRKGGFRKSRKNTRRKKTRKNHKRRKVKN